MSLSQEATDPASAAGAVEECDLVMKGGITSGIVYPRLVRALAERYRFRQIGGAAVLALAAELDGLGHPATSGSVPRPLAEMRLAPPI